MAEIVDVTGCCVYDDKGKRCDARVMQWVPWRGGASMPVCARHLRMLWAGKQLVPR